MDIATHQRVQESLRRLLEQLRALEDATRHRADMLLVAGHAGAGREARELLQAGIEAQAQVIGLVDAGMLVLAEIDRTAQEFRRSRLLSPGSAR